MNESIQMKTDVKSKTFQVTNFLQNGTMQHSLWYIQKLAYTDSSLR